MVDLSIIIPCFNESKNVVNITQCIQAALIHADFSYEILLIDDGRDNASGLLQELSQKYQNVRYKHGMSAHGIGAAVLEGFELAKGEKLIVMNADLQHPAELLPQMIEALAIHDVVIPSRFIPGGSDGELNPFRKLVSWAGRKIGQLALKPFRSASDFTSGCFGLHRDVINGVKLNPNSWKILMEILVKGRYQAIKEIPCQYVTRDLYDSKMSLRGQVRYLMHIAKLVAISPEDRRFYLFCFVGTLGVFVNLIFFHLFLFSGLHVLGASVFGSVVALAHNFLWNHYVTWGDCRPTSRRQQLMQIPQFVMISIIGVSITALTVKLYVNFGWSPSIGQLVGIGIATGWNYFGNKTWTWGAGKTQKPSV